MRLEKINLQEYGSFIEKHFSGVGREWTFLKKVDIKLSVFLD